MQLDQQLIALIEQGIEQGLISKRKHPTANLFILNYTPRTQYQWEWNQATINCRGLIVDQHYNVIAKPFPKFFNLDQWQTLRNNVHHLFGVKYKSMFSGPFSTTEKLDGSLGILYHDGNDFAIATRGSFESEQAIVATNILRTKYPHFQPLPNHTYLFEIIYPLNYIVVNYGNTHDLFLLTVLNNTTGLHTDTTHPFQVPKSFTFNTLDEVINHPQTQNAEGFVLHFHDSNVRLKFKFDEYNRLAKIRSNLNNEQAIWKALLNDEPLDLSQVPDELYQLIQSMQNEIDRQIARIEDDVRQMLDGIKHLSRKEIALHIQDYPYRSILFAMLDGKDYQAVIKRFVTPTTDEEE